MKTTKSMLTLDVLSRFEQEKDSNFFTEDICRTAEHAAYVAMMNRHKNAADHAGIWTADDIYNDFIRVLSIHGVSWASLPYRPVFDR